MAIQTVSQYGRVTAGQWSCQRFTLASGRLEQIGLQCQLKGVQWVTSASACIKSLVRRTKTFVKSSRFVKSCSVDLACWLCCDWLVWARVCKCVLAFCGRPLSACLPGLVFGNSLFCVTGLWLRSSQKPEVSQEAVGDILTSGVLSL